MLSLLQLRPIHLLGLFSRALDPGYDEGKDFARVWSVGLGHPSRNVLHLPFERAVGEAARIRGNRVRDLNKIQSEAYREVEEIRGEADARAASIYAASYAASPEAAEFYAFRRTLEAYPEFIGANSTLVLSTDSDLFRLLGRMDESPER